MQFPKINNKETSYCYMWEAKKDELIFLHGSAGEELSLNVINLQNNDARLINLPLMAPERFFL